MFDVQNFVVQKDSLFLHPLIMASSGFRYFKTLYRSCSIPYVFMGVSEFFYFFLVESKL